MSQWISLNIIFLRCHCGLTDLSENACDNAALDVCVCLSFFHDRNNLKPKDKN